MVEIELFPPCVPGNYTIWYDGCMPRKLFLWAVFFIAVLLTFVGLRSHSQSWYFQDETEHVALGWSMLRANQELYVDLSTNHQPIPVIVGGLLARFLPYNSLYLLVERLRLVMFGWLVLSGAFLVWRFRWRGLLASVFLLSLSYWYLGWYVLAESLAAPIVSGLFLFVLESIDKRWNPRNLDAIIIGASLFWITFNLVPLWPFALLSGIWFLWRFGPQQRKILVFIGTCLTILLFFFVPPLAWFEETVVNVVRYFLPYEAKANLLATLVYPIVNLTKPLSPIGRWYWLTTPVVALVLYGNRRRWPWLVPLGLLLSLNFRVDMPDATFYNGFHLFPYLAGWSALFALSATHLWRSGKAKAGKYLLVVVLLLLVGNNFSWVGEKIDKRSEHEINYGTHQSIANVLTLIKHPGDNLLTGPDGSGYINMFADMTFADRQNFHLNWAWRSPKLRAEFVEMMQSHPPEYIYFKTDQSSDYYLYLQPLLEQSYYRLSRADGRPTDLYARQDVAGSWTENQKQALVGQYFALPTGN